MPGVEDRVPSAGVKRDPARRAWRVEGAG